MVTVKYSISLALQMLMPPMFTVHLLKLHITASPLMNSLHTVHTYTHITPGPVCDCDFPLRLFRRSSLHRTSFHWTNQQSSAVITWTLLSYKHTWPSTVHWATVSLSSFTLLPVWLMNITQSFKWRTTDIWPQRCSAKASNVGAGPNEDGPWQSQSNPVFKQQLN